MVRNGQFIRERMPMGAESNTISLRKVINLKTFRIIRKLFQLQSSALLHNRWLSPLVDSKQGEDFDWLMTSAILKLEASKI